MMAVRDAEPRVRFLGYSVTSVKLFAFVLSAVLAGIAGALYVPQIGIINPERVLARQLDRDRDLGRGRRARHAGRRRSSARSRSTPPRPSSPAAFPETWLYCLGGLFILVTLLLPRGVMGAASGWMPGMRRRQARAPRGRQEHA